MDLNDFTSVDKAQPLQLLHPVTQEELEHEGKAVAIHVQGPDTDQMKKLERAVQSKRLKVAQRSGRVSINVADIEAETIERLATAITGWDNLFQDGKPLKYSHEAARELMKNFSWMREQVDQFYRDAGNFIKGTLMN